MNNDAEPDINLGQAFEEPTVMAYATTEPDMPGPVVATATAVFATEAREVNANFQLSSTLTDEQINIFKAQGFPTGLARELGNTRAQYPLRFWVVDNSGSMRTTDGNQIRGTRENVQVVQCTRWKELQDTVSYHAELAGNLEATTIFRLLNEPLATAGPQEFSIAETTTTSIAADVELAKSTMTNAEPKGLTPLTAHVMDIGSRIQSVEHILKGSGQQAVVVLATDGLPSDEKGESPPEIKDEFVNALRSLQKLPVWLVIRLCTDNDMVVDYYNDVDQKLELPLEVIDDFFGEGREIFCANDWLNYALPLHRCREMGYQHRIFDLLDERLLNKDELQTFFEIMFGKESLKDAPDIHTDWPGFVKALKPVVYAEGTQWNPNTRRLGYWVDFRRLERRYGPPSFCLCL